jgi:hypothetical protein
MERHVPHTVGIMVWGVICYGRRSPLISIQTSMAVVCCVKEVPEIVAVTMLIELISLFFNRITRVHILLMLLETFQNHLKMICKCIVSWGSSGDY